MIPLIQWLSIIEFILYLVVGVWWGRSLLYSLVQGPRLLLSYGHAILKGLGSSLPKGYGKTECKEDFPEDFSGSDQEVACVPSTHVPWLEPSPVCKEDQGVRPGGSLRSRAAQWDTRHSLSLWPTWKLVNQTIPGMGKRHLYWIKGL